MFVIVFYFLVFLMFFTQLKLQSRIALLMTSMTLGRGKDTRHARATVRVGIGLAKRRMASKR
jgi:hypothetical protein